MNLTKCENGHYYDRDRFPVCPHCGMAPEQPFPDPDGPETEPHAMQIRKCPAGHFYNAGRYASCPLCKTEQPPKPKELPELLPENTGSLERSGWKTGALPGWFTRSGEIGLTL